MRKKFLIFLCVITLTACSKPQDLIKVVNPVEGFATGFWQTVLIAEATTNFSSLLYDKTEAEFDTFIVHPVSILPSGSSFYLVPAATVDRNGKTHFNETHCNIIANYIRINNYGSIVKEPSKADYIIVVDINESLTRNYGKNRSDISVTIIDTDEKPVFISQMVVTSKSDENFYYYPTKGAKPTSYLTMKGLEKLFTEAMPMAFS